MSKPLYCELLDRLSTIYDGDNFLLGALASAPSDEERRMFIQAFDNGKLKTMDDVNSFANSLDQQRDELVDRWAKTHGFNGAEPTGELWNDYEIYEPSYALDEDGNYPCAGLPSFILLKGSEIRLTAPDEVWDVYHLLYPPITEE